MQNDRQTALTMLGRASPAIDQRIAAIFADDPAIKERVQQLYPDGLSTADGEAEAVAWRNRANADERAAAQARSTPDQPRTPQREDHTGQALARVEQIDAAAQHGIANNVAHTPAPPRTPPARRR